MTPFNLEGLAGVVATQGVLRWAAQLWGAAEALREAIDVPRLPVDRRGYEQAVATVTGATRRRGFCYCVARGMDDVARAKPLPLQENGIV